MNSSQNFVESDVFVKVLFERDLNSNKKKLRTNFLKPPRGKDEISAININLTNLNFCKKEGKRIQRISNRQYVGLCKIPMTILQKFKELSVKSSPNDENPHHVDIVYNTEKLKKDEPADSEIGYIAKQLRNCVTGMLDLRIDDEYWNPEYTKTLN